jgi:hypothetical protein
MGWFGHALGPSLENKPRSPSADEVIKYLRGLGEPLRKCVRQYIEWAPRQIDTEYRRKIVAALGWAFYTGESLLTCGQLS